MVYKYEIYRLGLDRRQIAEELGISYSSLANKLNSFCCFSGDEERRLQRIIEREKVKREQPATRSAA